MSATSYSMTYITCMGNNNNHSVVLCSVSLLLKENLKITKTIKIILILILELEIRRDYEEIAGIQEENIVRLSSAIG